MTLLQIAEAKEILSIESVSVLGLLLGVIALLIWHIMRINKNFEEKEKENAEIIKDKDEKITSFIEKYYTMSTKLYVFLNKDRDV